MLQRSKDFKPLECGPGAASPSQSGVPAAPTATYSAQSMQFLASGLFEYAHLATRPMGDGKSSCQQLQTFAGLARTTTTLDLSGDSLPAVEREVATACRTQTTGIGRRWWWLLSSLAGSQNPWLAVRVHLSLERWRCGSRLTPRYVVRIYVWYILLLSTS